MWLADREHAGFENQQWRHMKASKSDTDMDFLKETLNAVQGYVKALIQLFQEQKHYETIME